MSTILEALKKAEAERNGATQRPVSLLPPLAATSRNPPAWRRPLPWAAFAALAVALASAGWFTVNRTDSGKEVPASPAPLPAAAPPVVLAPPAELETPTEKPAPKKPVEKKRAAPPEEPKVTKAATEPAPGTLQELPPQIQGEIPALSVGGYIYSGNKADRTVLINNRLLREGDEAAPGLVVEKMTPSGMVLNYKGYRYRRSY